MGKSYCCGVGAGYYTVKALDWFCKAALQGHGGAQYQLGRYYGKRADTHWPPELRQDLVLAYMWYNLAALQNVPLAAAERDALATDLSTMELEEAQRHAREWRKIGCS
jgi:TPR repeat protein